MIVNLPADGVPSVVRMYRTEIRDTAPTELPLTSLGGGRWSVDTTGLISRWYPTVVFTQAGGPEQTLNLPYVDLPEVPDLIVSPETLARKAKIPLPLSEEDREQIIECIRDAQADVVGYLNRAIVPSPYTETGRYDVGGQWNLTPLDDPIIEITSVIAETSGGQPTGLFTIAYTAGLDAKNDPALSPIRRYVTAAAMNSPEFTLLWKTATKAKGDIKSVTTEGQSISYDKPTLGGGGKGQAGEIPSLDSVGFWRRLSVYQRKTEHRAPWPYTGYSDRGYR